MNSNGNKSQINDDSELPAAIAKADQTAQPPEIQTDGDSGEASVEQPSSGGAGGSADTASAAQEARKHWEQLLRTTADFDNYKKRAAREKQEAVKHANESLLKNLIPILDNLDMALAAVSQDTSAQNVQALQTGVAMIHQQLKTALADAGLSEIDATGQRFDPNIHEAVSQIDTSETPEGHVAQQLRKGYKLRDRLLRPAMVTVARKPVS